MNASTRGIKIGTIVQRRIYIENHYANDETSLSFPTCHRYRKLLYWCLVIAWRIVITLTPALSRVIPSSSRWQRYHNGGRAARLPRLLCCVSIGSHRESVIGARRVLRRWKLKREKMEWFYRFYGICRKRGKWTRASNGNNPSVSPDLNLPTRIYGIDEDRIDYVP